MKWKEIKPSLFFLGRFLIFYLIVNLVYGWWVTSYEPTPDPITVSATHQSVFLLNLMGYDVDAGTHPSKAAERVFYRDGAVLSVHEGCNGVNIWIIFVGFLMAFSGLSKRVFLFLVAGTVVIHVVNLGRIVVLFFISLKYPQALYFFHKYFLTAGIYIVVFALWYFWITKYDKPQAKRI